MKPDNNKTNAPHRTEHTEFKEKSANKILDRLKHTQWWGWSIDKVQTLKIKFP